MVPTMFTWNCEPFAALMPSTDLCHLVNHADGELHCIVCDAPALSACAKCAMTPYCSKACQAVDWQVVHKVACRVLRVMYDRDVRGGAPGDGPTAGGAAGAGAGGHMPVPPSRLPEGMCLTDFTSLAPMHGYSTPPKFAVEGVPAALGRLDGVLAPDDATRVALGKHLATPGHRKVRLETLLEGVACAASDAHTFAVDPSAVAASTITLSISHTVVTEVATGLWRGKCMPAGQSPVWIVAPLSTWVWIVGASLALHPIGRGGDNPVLSAALMQMQDEAFALDRSVIVQFTVKVTVNDKQAVAATCPLVAVPLSV